MLLAAKLTFKFLRLLNSETPPLQLSAGLCFGLIVGFSPFFTWHNLLIFLLVCLLRVNLSMFLLGTAFFSIIAFVLDPLFDVLGYFLLVDVKALRPLWIYFSSTPILPYFRFNNTVVIGSLALGLLLYLPFFLVSVWAIKKYRQHWREQIRNSELMQALRASKLFSSLAGAYQKYSDLRSKFS